VGYAGHLVKSKHPLSAAKSAAWTDGDRKQAVRERKLTSQRDLRLRDASGRATPAIS
jgi:hypothetical protein